MPSFVKSFRRAFLLLVNLDCLCNETGAKAPGADYRLPVAAANFYPHSLKVGEHLALGPVISMTDVIAHSPSLSANVTACQFSSPPLIDLNKFSMITLLDIFLQAYAWHTPACAGGTHRLNGKKKDL
jgi:hypothetical protein